jgi:hypothetical protein
MMKSQARIVNVIVALMVPIFGIIILVDISSARANPEQNEIGLEEGDRIHRCSNSFIIHSISKSNSDVLWQKLANVTGLDEILKSIPENELRCGGMDDPCGSLAKGIRVIGVIPETLDKCSLLVVGGYASVVYGNEGFDEKIYVIEVDQESNRLISVKHDLNYSSPVIISLQSELPDIDGDGLPEYLHKTYSEYASVYVGIFEETNEQECSKCCLPNENMTTLMSSSGNTLLGPFRMNGLVENSGLSKAVSKIELFQENYDWSNVVCPPLKAYWGNDKHIGNIKIARKNSQYLVRFNVKREICSGWQVGNSQPVCKNQGTYEVIVHGDAKSHKRREKKIGP